MPFSARQLELTARHLLAHPEQIAVYLKERRCEELAALVEFVHRDAPTGLAQTDPALYRLLRRQITEFHLRGWTCLDLPALKTRAQPAPPQP